MLFFLSSSRTCVCPPVLSSVYGGDQAEESVSVARRTLPTSRLRTPPPHSHSGPVPEPADPPPCPPLPPPPLPAKTADPLQHLYSTAGQTTYECNPCAIQMCYICKYINALCSTGITELLRFITGVLQLCIIT